MAGLGLRPLAFDFAFAFPAGRVDRAGALGAGFGFAGGFRLLAIFETALEKFTFKNLGTIFNDVLFINHGRGTSLGKLSCSRQCPFLSPPSSCLKVSQALLHA